MGYIVVTPPASHRLTTVANVRADLGIGSEVSDSALLRLIDAASDAAERYCRRSFGRQTIRETFGVYAWACGVVRPLTLSFLPVASILSVTGSALYDPSEYELQGADLYLLNASGARTYWGGSISVDYIAGYVLPGESPISGAPELPLAIERAVISEVQAMRSSNGRDPTLKSVTVYGISSHSYETRGSDRSSLTSGAAESALDMYRLPGVA